ncbi:hypothetical protein KY284_032376 [Solanum tuberosum]|nr:hypothetical protein KY284_032376 [Solanum tuberosum]
MYHLYNERWYRQDQLLRSALIASPSIEVVSLVNTAETSYDVWNTLCSMYAKLSRAQILSLKDSLTRATKGTQSMSAYLQHIKQLVTTFNSIGAAITLDDVTIYVLNGLPSEYKGIFDFIQTRDTSLNFNELYEKLCDYEQQLQRDPTPPTFPLTANFAAKTNSFNSRNKSSNTGSNRFPFYPIASMFAFGCGVDVFGPEATVLDLKRFSHGKATWSLRHCLTT